MSDKTVLIVPDQKPTPRENDKGSTNLPGDTTTPNTVRPAQQGPKKK